MPHVGHIAGGYEAPDPPTPQGQAQRKVVTMQQHEALGALQRSRTQLECGVEMQPTRNGVVCDATALEGVTVNGVRPTPGEPREMPVVEDAPRLGRAIAA